MSYQVHNFQTGDIIEAAPVNEMDAQIQSNEQELKTKVSGVAYDSTNKNFTQTINGTTTNITSINTLKTDMNLTKADVGLSNVNNTSDANKPISNATQAALDEKISCTKPNIVSALGFTPTTKGQFTWGDLYEMTV